MRTAPDSDIYIARSAPEVEFDYSRPVLDDRARTLSGDALENLPQGVDGERYQWLDLDGDGLPGILARRSGPGFSSRTSDRAGSAWSDL